MSSLSTTQDVQHPIKAITANLPIRNGVSIDCYEMPDGEKRIGLVGASEAIGVFAKEWILALPKAEIFWVDSCDGICSTIPRTVFLKTLADKAFSGEVNSIRILCALVSLGTTINLGSNCVDSITPQSFFGKTMPKEYAENATSLDSVEKSQTEKVWQKKIATQINGRMEVTTPVGRIDVLSDDLVGEVKEARQWKHALGQVQAYSHFYKDRRKVLYLFGDVENQSDIKYVCSLLDVEVEFLRES